MTAHTTFTPAQDAMIRRLWGRRSIDRIAAEIGRARASVWYRVRKLGLDPRPGRRWHRWTAAEDTLVTELWRAGTPLRDIATRVGLTLWQVDNRRVRLGLPNRKGERHRFTPDDDALIIARWQEGPVVIGRILGRPACSISRRALSKLGLPGMHTLKGHQKAGPKPRRWLPGPDKARLQGARA